MAAARGSRDCTVTAWDAATEANSSARSPEVASRQSADRALRASRARAPSAAGRSLDLRGSVGAGVVHRGSRGPSTPPRNRADVHALPCRQPGEQRALVGEPAGRRGAEACRVPPRLRWPWSAAGCRCRPGLLLGAAPGPEASPSRSAVAPACGDQREHGARVPQPTRRADSRRWRRCRHRATTRSPRRPYPSRTPRQGYGRYPWCLSEAAARPTCRIDAAAEDNTTGEEFS